MYPVSPQFLDTLRGPFTPAVRVDVDWPDGSTTTDLEVGDSNGNAGQVVDDATSKVRRMLTLNVADMSAWRDIVLGGAVIRPYRGLTYVDQTDEMVPLGVFEVRGTSEDISGLTAGRVTAPDRWRRIQRARFYVPESSGPNSVADEWIRLVRAGLGDSTAPVSDLSGNGTLCPSTVWPRDRDAALEGLAESIGCEGFFDATGVAVLRPIPDVNADPVWTIDTGPSGVLIGATTERSDDQTYSAVVVAPSRADGTVPFAPVVIEDLDPASPTYVSGPFGRVPRFYTSPVIATEAQATTAGTALLRKVTGRASSVTLTSIPNPALASGDVIAVPNAAGQLERHVIDSITQPLNIADAQPISTRSLALPLPDEDAA